MAPRKGQCEDVHLYTGCEVYPTCLTVSSFEVTVVTGAGVAPEDFITRTTIVTRVAVTLQEVWNFTDALYNVVHVITTVFHEKKRKIYWFHHLGIQVEHGHRKDVSSQLWGIELGIYALRALTHWCRDEMGNMSQTTFSNVLSLMDFFLFRLKFLPKRRVNNIPALVQMMAWRRLGDKPLLEPMMASLPTHICVSRPQWIIVLTTNMFILILHHFKQWLQDLAVAQQFKCHGVSWYGRN